MQMLVVPGACRTLVERSLSTDDIESEFALLVHGCGYKPTPQMAPEYLKRVDFLHHMRRQGGRSTRTTTWNDAQMLAEPAVLHQGQTREAAVRSHHRCDRLSVLEAAGERRGERQAADGRG
jgi:hypothetical protein